METASRYSKPGDRYASAEHLQLASSALGLNDGLTTATPIAMATAIFISVNIIMYFLWSEQVTASFPRAKLLSRAAQFPAAI
jgi:hypothetical protein